MQHWWLEQFTLLGKHCTLLICNYRVISKGFWNLIKGEAAPDVCSNTAAETSQQPSSCQAGKGIKHSHNWGNSCLLSGYKHSTNWRHREILQQHPIPARKGEGIQGREKLSNLHMWVLRYGGCLSSPFTELQTLWNWKRHLNRQAQVLRFLKLLHTVTEGRWKLQE